MLTTHPDTALCPDCEPRPLLKNHWFWGKSVLPRDMTDEQNWVAEHIRLHHQRLHGTGIVCGLRLVQHPNPACRDRLAVLEPGSAIDCCGHHILVLEEEVVDLDAFEAVRALKAAPNGKPHTLRFCIRYRECPTEEVPVLYDECACDDTRCAPNRILESWTLEIEVDPPRPVRAYAQPRLERAGTLLIPGASAVVLDDAGGRLFAAVGNTVMELDAATQLPSLPARDLGAPVRAMALGAGGSRLDLVVGGGAGSDPKLTVLDVGGPTPLATAALRDGALAGALAGSVALTETAAGELVSVIEPTGGLRWFAAGVAAPGAPDRQVDLGVKTAGLALSGDGRTAWLAEPGKPSLHAVALDVPAPTAAKVGVKRVGQGGATTPVRLDRVRALTADGPDRVVGLERATSSLHLVDPATGTVENSVVLEHPPMDAVVSPDGRWAYVVVADGAGDGHVQPVSLHAMRLGKSVNAGPAFAVGPKAGTPAITAKGDRLYVPLANGIAVIDVGDVDCASLLEGGDCPGCLEADCLVVARMDNWQPTFRLTDLPPGPHDLAADAAAGIVRIDNDAERTVLPSTQAIAAALRCFIENGGGGAAGAPGMEGPPGKEGPEGKRGPPGKDGPSAVDLTLTRICAINWEHARDWPMDRLGVHARAPGWERRGYGLVIAFTNEVLVEDLNDISFMPLVETPEQEAQEFQRNCWCQIPGEVFGVRLEQRCTIPPPVTELDVLPGGASANAALYLFADRAAARLRNLVAEGRLRVRVLFNGDLVRDDVVIDGVRKHRGVDADHLPPWVSKRESGDFIEGGMFESWFRLGREG
jgi:DNA-binding beta-propeller fold protein YncE